MSVSYVVSLEVSQPSMAGLTSLLAVSPFSALCTRCFPEESLWAPAWAQRVVSCPYWQDTHQALSVQRTLKGRIPAWLLGTRTRRFADKSIMTF